MHFNDFWGEEIKQLKWKEIQRERHFWFAIIHTSLLTLLIGRQMYMKTHTHTAIDTNICTHTQISTRTLVHTQSCVHMCTYTQTYTHRYIHTHTHIYTYTDRQTDTCTHTPHTHAPSICLWCNSSWSSACFARYFSCTIFKKPPPTFFTTPFAYPHIWQCVDRLQLQLTYRENANYNVFFDTSRFQENIVNVENCNL